MPDQKEKYVQLDEVIARHRGEPGALMPVLQEAQNIFGYVPLDVQEKIADGLGTTLSEVYGVATFYSQFSLEPKGKHIIKVCDGTACHVRKSGPIYDAIHEYLGLEGKKKTSADGVFTLETVACLGACGLAPAMTIDGEVYAKMSPETALAELERLRGEEAAQ